MDSGFQVLNIRIFVSGTWMPDSNRWIRGIPDLLSCILDFKAQDPDSSSMNFPDFGFYKPYFLTWGDYRGVYGVTTEMTTRTSQKQ